MSNYIEVGKVTSTKGLRGELKVQSWCNTPHDLCKFRELFFNSSGYEVFAVERCRISGDFSAVLKLSNVNSVEKAEGLVNKILYADRKEIALKEGEFLIADLIGVKVVDYNNENMVYGEIVDVIKSSNRSDLYEVLMKNGQKSLIPAVEEIVKSKDVDEGIVRIKPINGLFECAY